MPRSLSPLFLFCLLIPLVPMDLGAMERFPIVTTRELVSLLDQRANGEKEFILVHTLGELIFQNQSIPGSINLPWTRVSDLALERLGPEPDILIITYCMGYR
ncbi:MAG: hypothetical protein HUN04_01030 [Desulfobacter sp.]|nr:MAG: hypothetical protein HUN04_01030 [Desulfobacter sp.]